MIDEAGRRVYDTTRPDDEEQIRRADCFDGGDPSCFRQSFTEPDHGRTKRRPARWARPEARGSRDVDPFLVAAGSMAAVYTDRSVQVENSLCSGPLEQMVDVLGHMGQIGLLGQCAVSGVRLGRGEGPPSVVVPIDDQSGVGGKSCRTGQFRRVVAGPVARGRIPECVNTRLGTQACAGEGRNSSSFGHEGVGVFD